MYKLKLVAKDCISCGICMDVCLPQSISMRIFKGPSLEGKYLAYLNLNSNSNYELLPEDMMTFPFMIDSELCSGCMICVKECPTSAIDIVNDVELKDHYYKETVYEA